jgi:hypothetical protein
MRIEAIVRQRRTRNKAGPEDGAGPGTSSFSRAQLLALLVGLVQIVLASIPFLPMGEGAVHTLYVCTGLAGVVLAWRHSHARCYGVLLLLLYGQLFISDADDTGVLGLPTWETLAYGRAAVAGVVIALIPAFKRR